MLYTNKYRILTLILTIFAFTIIGCDESEEHEESQDEHVCEHFLYGPEVEMTASADYQSAIDNYNADATYLVQYELHTRYDVMLLADTSGHYYGHVPYRPISDEGDYILYMDQAVDVTIRNTEDGSVVVAEETEDHSDDCAAVTYKGVYHLHADDTYVLSFDDLHESTIGMLFPKAADEDEDDHDH
ncbi:MAG: hypothetical protein H8E18_00155 [FCB group bacterium]|nr:hypothetical protein [FCB group bacterium]